MKSFWENHLYNKPAWLTEYEYYEDTLVRRSGIDKKKLRELIRLFQEYKILEEEGK